MKPYLVYSPDEGFWYWQDGDNTSQPFIEKSAAVEAMNNDNIDWYPSVAQEERQKWILTQLYSPQA